MNTLNTFVNLGLVVYVYVNHRPGSLRKPCKFTGLRVIDKHVYGTCFCEGDHYFLVITDLAKARTVGTSTHA